MGGRSLDDSDEEDDSDEDEDPRLHRLLLKNCAFYNTKTSTNLPCPRQHSSLFQFTINFTTDICCLIPPNRFGRCLVGHESSVDRNTALQECGRDVKYLIIISIPQMSVLLLRAERMSMFFFGGKESSFCGLMLRHESQAAVMEALPGELHVPTVSGQGETS